MAEFSMPALGADMETGKVVQWLVQPGDRVKPGDVVAVVETHKGAIDVECFLDGVIDELAPLDTDLPVGARLARVQTAGRVDQTPAAIPSPLAAPPAARAPAPASPLPPSPPAPSATAPAAPALALHQPLPAAAGVPGLTPARPEGAAALPTGSTARAPGVSRPAVSPAARRRAAQVGLDPAALPGTGVDGAVTLADVERAMHLPRPAPGVAPAAPRSDTGAPEPIAPSRTARSGFDPAQMRQAIAAAMGRSKREIPHYYLAETIDFSAAQAWLEAYNATREPADRLLPAVLLLKAAARALAEVPQLNGFWEADAFRPGAAIHVGWAIALRGGGLVAPAIRHADTLDLPTLMTRLRDLVQRARAGGLRSSELTDPTVTVTSLGERGAASVLGVIYPPQVAILGFGRVMQRPWVVDGQVRPRWLVEATLAADHRASDGHGGGKLLAALAAALQAPERL